MNETYTFSRALHLMRYSEKKMRPVGEDNFFYYSVIKNTLMIHLKTINFPLVANDDNLPNNEEIMGSWIEVKDNQ
jgi:hypothetical protein